MEVVVTTGAISRAKLQSNHHHQQTNIQFFTSRMPFLWPNQQCQSIEGKISHSMDLLTPSSSGGLPTLSLTTNSSWLPWGRFAMPLISPLMPVPLLTGTSGKTKIAPALQKRSSLPDLYQVQQQSSPSQVQVQQKWTWVRTRVSLQFRRAHIQSVQRGSTR